MVQIKEQAELIRCVPGLGCFQGPTGMDIPGDRVPPLQLCHLYLLEGKRENNLVSGRTH